METPEEEQNSSDTEQAEQQSNPAVIENNVITNVTSSMDVIAPAVIENSVISNEANLENGSITPEKSNPSQAGLCQSTSALHKNRKRQRKPPLVDTDVRRSDRLKGQTKGYKRNVYRHKDCFARSGAPPTPGCLGAWVPKSANTTTNTKAT